MARIDLEAPYTSFLESQVKAGLFNTISEAARDAIRRRMEDHEHNRLLSIEAALAKGEADIKAGRTVRYTDSLMSGILQLGKRDREEHMAIKKKVCPSKTKK